MSQPSGSRHEPNAAPLGAGKKELRLWAKDQRSRARAYSGAALDEYVRDAIESSALYHLAHTVGIYLPVGDEVNIEPLLAGSKRFVAPRMNEEGGPHLTFHELDDGTELHPWGVRQPVPHARKVAATGIDLLLVPGLLFDEYGGRLGYGKGYYDRVLAECTHKPITVGVTFGALLVPRLPLDEHDVAVQNLVTESGIRPVRR